VPAPGLARPGRAPVALARTLPLSASGFEAEFGTPDAIALPRARCIAAWVRSRLSPDFRSFETGPGRTDPAARGAPTAARRVDGKGVAGPRDRRNADPLERMEPALGQVGSIPQRVSGTTPPRCHLRRGCSAPEPTHDDVRDGSRAVQPVEVAQLRSVARLSPTRPDTLCTSDLERRRCAGSPSRGRMRTHGSSGVAGYGVPSGPPRGRRSDHVRLDPRRVGFPLFPSGHPLRPRCRIRWRRDALRACGAPSPAGCCTDPLLRPEAGAPGRGCGSCRTVPRPSARPGPAGRAGFGRIRRALPWRARGRAHWPGKGRRSRRGAAGSRSPPVCAAAPAGLCTDTRSAEIGACRPPRRRGPRGGRTRSRDRNRFRHVGRKTCPRRPLRERRPGEPPGVSQPRSSSSSSSTRSPRSAGGSTGRWRAM